MKNIKALALLVMVLVILFLSITSYKKSKEENQFPINISGDTMVGTNDGKRFAYVQKVGEIDGKYFLIVDFATWVSPCDDSDCPNGFKIENSEVNLLNFPISKEVVVRMATYSHALGGNFNYDESISLATFKGLIDGTVVVPSYYDDGITGKNPYINFYVKNEFGPGIPFWLTIKNDIITEIDEQYLP